MKGSVKGSASGAPAESTGAAAPRDRTERLRTALRDVLGLVEAGHLVRDTACDVEPSRALGQLRTAEILAEAAAALEDEDA